MSRHLASAALLALSFAAQAHLNHVQFAAVDEIDDMLRVRYRMSADMFMSNLDLDIKGGRIAESIKQLPIDQIIARYFETHLQLETKKEALSAKSVTFTFDAKNGDWIADFMFPSPAPDSDAWIFCDAFLQNNPRTQTLGRINWRGEQAVFHFRKENERYRLGSSLPATVAAIEPATSARIRFVEGLAEGMRSYLSLTLAALLFCGLRMVLKSREILLEGVAVLALIVFISASAPLNASKQWGFWIAWIVVAFTAQKVFFDVLSAIKRRTERA